MLNIIKQLFVNNNNNNNNYNLLYTPLNLFYLLCIKIIIYYLLNNLIYIF